MMCESRGLSWELSPQTGVFQEGDFWPEILVVSISKKGKRSKIEHVQKFGHLRSPLNAKPKFYETWWINYLFSVLSWDVHNSQHHRPHGFLWPVLWFQVRMSWDVQGAKTYPTYVTVANEQRETLVSLSLLVKFHLLLIKQKKQLTLKTLATEVVISKIMFNSCGQIMRHLDKLQNIVWVFPCKFHKSWREIKCFLLCYLKLKNYMAEILLRNNLFYKIPDEMIFLIFQSNYLPFLSFLRSCLLLERRMSCLMLWLFFSGIFVVFAMWYSWL